MENNPNPIDPTEVHEGIANTENELRHIIKQLHEDLEQTEYNPERPLYLELKRELEAAEEAMAHNNKVWEWVVRGFGDARGC